MNTASPNSKPVWQFRVRSILPLSADAAGNLRSSGTPLVLLSALSGGTVRLRGLALTSSVFASQVAMSLGEPKSFSVNRNAPEDSARTRNVAAINRKFANPK